MPRPKPHRPTAEEIATRKAAETARADSRAQWIADNPDAHAAEQEALAAAQAQRIAVAGGE